MGAGDQKNGRTLRRTSYGACAEVDFANRGKLRGVSRPTIRRGINSHMFPKIFRFVVSEKFNMIHNWLSTCSAQSSERINCCTLECVIGTRFRELSPKLRIGSAFANCGRNLRFPAKCLQKARSTCVRVGGVSERCSHGKDIMQDALIGDAISKKALGNTA